MLRKLCYGRIHKKHEWIFKFSFIIDKRGYICSQLKREARSMPSLANHRDWPLFSVEVRFSVRQRRDRRFTCDGTPITSIGARIEKELVRTIAYRVFARRNSQQLDHSSNGPVSDRNIDRADWYYAKIKTDDTSRVVMFPCLTTNRHHEKKAILHLEKLFVQVYPRRYVIEVNFYN